MKKRKRFLSVLLAVSMTVSPAAPEIAQASSDVSFVSEEMFSSETADDSAGSVAMDEETDFLAGECESESYQENETEITDAGTDSNESVDTDLSGDEDLIQDNMTDAAEEGEAFEEDADDDQLIDFTDTGDFDDIDAVSEQDQEIVQDYIIEVYSEGELQKSYVVPGEDADHALAPEALEREGYSFEGWLTSVNGEEEEYQPGGVYF